MCSCIHAFMQGVHVCAEAGGMQSFMCEVNALCSALSENIGHGSMFLNVPSGG